MAKKLNISEDSSCIDLKLCTVVTLITKFHDISTVGDISMAIKKWVSGPLYSKDKIRVF